MTGRPNLDVLCLASVAGLAWPYVPSEVLRADCGHDTWLAPSSRALLLADPNIRTVCDDCLTDAELAAADEVSVVPGSVEETTEVYGVAAADQALAAARDRYPRNWKAPQ